MDRQTFYIISDRVRANALTALNRAPDDNPTVNFRRYMDGDDIPLTPEWRG